MSFEDALAKLQNELSNQISKVTSEVRATKEEVLKKMLLLKDCRKKIISCVQSVLS